MIRNKIKLQYLLEKNLMKDDKLKHQKRWERLQNTDLFRN